MPKVSVIIPVYGVEKHIERCARSLFEQTLDDIEFLFIDDCSPDKSIEILETILEEYPQRKYQTIIHRMESNSGQAAVRRWGIINAHGDFLIHCDSDDWVAPEIYKTMWEYAVDKSLDIVSCDYIITDDTIEKVFSIQIPNEKENVLGSLITHTLPVCVWNKLVKADVCKMHIIYPTCNFGEDYALVIQYYYYAERIGHINTPLYYYFNNNNSITRLETEDAIFKRYVSGLDNFNIVLSFIKEIKLENELEVPLIKAKVQFMTTLIPLVHIKKYRRDYLSVFPRIFFQMIKSKDFIGIVRYCAVKLNLYRLLRSKIL